MATHSSTLAWKIPWMGSLVGCTPWGCKESDTTERLHFHFSLSCIEEGNGNPLQCFCLENPRDRGTWWAAISGAAQSQTRLKQLSSSSSRNANQQNWLESCLCVHTCILSMPAYSVKVVHLCLTLCNPMDFAVHGILQARILEWVAFPFSRGSYQPRGQIQIFHFAGRFFTS